MPEHIMIGDADPCKHYEQGCCLIATDLATNYDPTVRCLTTEQACRKCSSLHHVDRALNEVTGSLCLLAFKGTDKVPQIVKDLKPVLRVEKAPEYTQSGVGTELHKMTRWFTTASCRCESRVQIMNVWGPERCEENTAIILGWLAEAAHKRGVPYFEWFARQLIKNAIRKVRKRDV